MNLEDEVKILRDEVQSLRKALKEALRLIEEQKEEIRRLKGRNSKNSSQPPSQDFKGNCEERKNRGGGQKGHRGHHRSMLGLDRVDECHHLEVEECISCCSRDLKILEKKGHFQFVDFIQHRIVVQDFHRTFYYCRSCQVRFFAPLPKEVGPSNFGHGLKALIAFVTGHLHLSKRQACTLLKQVHGIAISVGSICAIESQLSRSLESSYESIRKRFRAAGSPIYVDETTWRNQGKNCFIWSASGKDFSFFEILPRRNRASRDQLLGSHFKGPIVSDRFSVYSNLRAPHQYCLAHLLRNLQAFAESKTPSSPPAIELISLFKDVFRIWHRHLGGALSRSQVRSRLTFQRGEIKNILQVSELDQKGKFARFCSKLLDQYDRLWTFLRVPGMEPTNNEAERSLRSLVLYRKKSLGTQSPQGKTFVSRMASVCQTLIKKKIPVLPFLQNPKPLFS